MGGRPLDLVRRHHSDQLGRRHGDLDRHGHRPDRRPDLDHRDGLPGDDRDGRPAGQHVRRDRGPRGDDALGVLDSAIDDTQGDILYRGASVWTNLAPGTSGDFLTTGGASANPSWTAGNAGTVTSVAAGTGLAGGTITSTGTLSLATITSHDVMANTTGGTAAPAGVTLSSLLDAAIDNTQGDILYRGSSTWTDLGPGTAGNVLQTGGASANPSYRPTSQVNVYTASSQTYTVPTWANFVRVQLIGSGGSGGSGGVGATSIYGATGGAAGGYVDATFRTADLTSTVTVAVGQAGSNAAGVTSGTGTNGGTGSPTSFGAYAVAGGGQHGFAGGTSAPTQANSGGNGWPSGAPGAAASITATPAAAGGTNSEPYYQIGAGGSGGGITSGGAALAGGSGGSAVFPAQGTGTTGGGANTGANAGNGSSGGTVTTAIAFGSGGGGGGGIVSGTGGSGGNGGSYGAGGGGGGSSTSGTSGAGGAGAAGIAVITAW